MGALVLGHVSEATCPGGLKATRLATRDTPTWQESEAAFTRWGGGVGVGAEREVESLPWGHQLAYSLFKKSQTLL